MEYHTRGSVHFLPETGEYHAEFLQDSPYSNKLYRLAIGKGKSPLDAILSIKYY